jgi:hypothetical protein
MSVHRIRIFGRLSRQSLTLIVLTCITLLGGCATLGATQPQPPVTVSEVIQMSKEDVPADTIIERMRDSDTVYRLTAAQLAELHEQGISDQVIDYMQQTYLDAVRQDQSLADWDYWTVGADGFWYGGPYYGWPLDGWVVGHRGRGWRDGRGWHDGDEGERGREGGDAGRDGGGRQGEGGFGGHGGGAGGHGGR